MTNAGALGWPTGASGGVQDGSVTAAKLASPLGWGRLASGRYYYTTGTTGTSTSATLGNGTLRLMPWYVPNAVTLSKIGAEVTSAGDGGSLLRLGIYADDGTCYPGSLVLDAGTIAGDSATVQEISVNQALQPGLYWIGAAVQLVTVTQPTVRTPSTLITPFPLPATTSTPSSNATPASMTQGSVTGALPAVFQRAIGASVTPGPRVFVKVS